MSASQVLSREATAADQVLIYRNILYAIGKEVGGARHWAIYPRDAPLNAQPQGISSGDRGSDHSGTR